MMEYLNILLVSIGGTTAVLLIAGFLSKSLMTHLFTKEIERYKQEINHLNNAALEKIKIELQQNAKSEDRLIEYDQVMKRYQGPLLHATYELQSRLFNIIVQNFLQKYFVHGKNHERDYAINHTVFVIAQYFAWTEIIRKEVQFIDFNTLERTKTLSQLRDNIYHLWQTDTLHDLFRIWAGEQRAIGELMIEENQHGLGCIGYANFLEKMQCQPNPLFKKITEDITTLSTSHSDGYARLTKIQHALIDILNYIDPDFIRFPKERRSYSPPTQKTQP